jgi:hypothetical protein
MSKLTLIVDQDECDYEGIYAAPATHTFEHDTDGPSDTWLEQLRTFMRVLDAQGFIGHREKIKYQLGTDKWENMQ